MTFVSGMDVNEFFSYVWPKSCCRTLAVYTAFVQSAGSNRITMHIIITKNVYFYQCAQERYFCRTFFMRARAFFFRKHYMYLNLERVRLRPLYRLEKLNCTYSRTLQTSFCSHPKCISLCIHLVPTALA